jgi:hypothetical protein
MSFDTTVFISCVSFVCKLNCFQKVGKILYTGRFIMFSMITNSYNKKTKGPTLMEFFTSTGKLMKFCLTTRDVRCVRHGWHGSHRCNIQVLTTHASTWVSRAMMGRKQYVPPLPRDLDDLKARIIAAVKNIYIPMLTRVWQELNILSIYAVSPVVHISNISSCQKRFQFSCGYEQFHWGRSFGFLVINICNHGEHYETSCIGIQAVLELH